MTERASLFCGCLYIRTAANGQWYQVVACPDHDMDMSPQDEVPNRKPGHEVES